jgi:ribosomal protein L11 methyltransferase
VNYIKVNITLIPLLPAREVLYADLELLGFESIVDTENGVEAYIQEIDFNGIELEDLMVSGMPEQKVLITVEKIEKQNWNATWENNFEIIEVNDKCAIRAPFHEHTGKKFDIIIAPQMSFGTGHHETTFLMSQRLFELSINSSMSLLDMGAGTGVLAIIASKLGVKSAVAIDIEEWAYQNALANCVLNNVTNVEVRLGDAELLVDEKYDIILANINRNVLLQDMEQYVHSLNKNGLLLLSGFYTTDIEILTEKAYDFGLTFEYQNQRNNWALLQFKKNFI